MSRDLKKQLYTFIKPIVIYGAETWVIRKTNENRHLVFERKILRTIFGPVNDIVTNDEELESLYLKPSIVETIRN